MKKKYPEARARETLHSFRRIGGRRTWLNGREEMLTQANVFSTTDVLGGSPEPSKGSGGWRRPRGKEGAPPQSS
jgi:hypothetical protein